jgi:hypothetical protein
MKTVVILVLLLCATLLTPAQQNADLQKLVGAEHAFARMASEKGIKAAFLAYIADDGLIFRPEPTNGKVFWTSRPDSPAILTWAPNYSDLSSNGILGYTTGNWEYCPQNGEYKFVVDIGINHPKPAKYSTDWVTATEETRDPNERNTTAADVAQGFYNTAATKGAKSAYKEFGADDIRLYREGKFPILGKKAALDTVNANDSTIGFAKRGVFFGAADISYSLNTYSITISGKVNEKGNSLQIWKLVHGKWHIVLDILKPVT